MKGRLVDIIILNWNGGYVFDYIQYVFNPYLINSMGIGFIILAYVS